MPDGVIARVNSLGKDQPDHYTFTDRQGRQIGDVEIPGVDMNENDNDADLDANENENDNDADNQNGATVEDDLDQPDVNDQELAALPEDQLEPEPIIELEALPADQGDTLEGLPETAPPEPIIVETVEPEAPENLEQGVQENDEQLPGVRRSTRTKAAPKDYVPSMGGTKYETVMTQLEQEGTLHPDAHLFFNEAQVEEPAVIIAIMTQLSLKMGLKTCLGEGSHRGYEVGDETTPPSRYVPTKTQIGTHTTRTGRSSRITYVSQTKERWKNKGQNGRRRQQAARFHIEGRC